MRRICSIPIALVVVSLFGCGDDELARVEGTEPGDCSDAADNDRDGLFDCADDSCAASPDCIAVEAGIDARLPDASLPDAASQSDGRVLDAMLDALVRDASLDASEPDGAVDAQLGQDAAPDAAVLSCTGGGTYSFFLNPVDLSLESGGEVGGVNLDGQDNTGSTVTYSNDEDGRPCQQRPDFSLPGGSALGIDNSFGKLLTDIATEVPQIDLDFGTALAESIKNGELMLAIRIHNVHLEAGKFPTNDNCVNAEIVRVVTPGGWASQGSQPNLNQSFDVHASSFDNITGQPVVRFLQAEIVGGRLVGQSISTLPVAFDGTDADTVDFGVIDPVLDLAVAASGITDGYFGGRLAVNGLADELIDYDASELSAYKAVFEQLLINYADLNPVDPQTGAVCQNISIGFTVDGTPVSLTDPI